MNKIEKPQSTTMNHAGGVAVGHADSEPSIEATPNEIATIGASIKIAGDLNGKEDLLINGTVDGTIDFREHQVTVGEQGRVNANVTARTITISGEVKGELRGSEQVTIKPSGRVTGDIRAPRVVLNDGCQFKGLVDMEDKPHTPGDPRPAPHKLSQKPFSDRAPPLPTPPQRKP